MKLTDQEKRMLDGEHGEAVQYSMQILCKCGEGYEAERLVEVESVHAAAVYAQFLASVELMESYAERGGKFCVPTTTDPAHQVCHFNRWPDLREPPDYHEKARRMLNAVEKMGAIPNYSCTPYFQGNVPRFGRAVAWVETSAISYVNSVLGARANRIADGVEVAAAITGRIPEFGLLLDENRKGNALVRVEYTPKSLTDFGTIGYIIGKLAGDKIPVIEGLPSWTSANDFKMLGAAAGSRGAVSLYHAVGLTPEAATRKQAFGKNKPLVAIKIGPEEIASAVHDINTAENEQVDAVLLGCPHPTIWEVREIAQLLAGKRVKAGMKFWIFISFDVLQMARQMGYAGIIEQAGGEFVVGDCILFFEVRDWGWKAIATNSAKYANILPSPPTRVKIIYRDVAGCVALATR